MVIICYIFKGGGKGWSLPLVINIADKGSVMTASNLL